MNVQLRAGPVLGADDPNDYRFADELEGELIAQVRAIRPLLQRCAPENEKLRNLCPEVQEALDTIPGIWTMAVPRRWGGLGCSANTVARVSAELAMGDPAVAWVVQIVGGTTWVTTLASDECQEALFSNGPVKICGAFTPPGIAVPVEGGYIVNGKFPYSSGCKVSDWYQWGGILKKADGTQSVANFCYVPMSAITIEDTWFTPGLQGTGSDTAIIKDVFVPEALWVDSSRPYGTRYPGKKHCGAPSDYWPQIAFVHRTAVGQLCGMAEAALELLRSNADKRPIAVTTYTRQADSQVFQRDLGECAIKIQTARMLVEASTKEIDEAALTRQMLPSLDRARNKVQASFAVQQLAEAFDKMMFLAGSGAFNRANAMSRFWTDFSLAARHIANIPNVGFEVYGRALLGVEPNIVPPFMI
jgi:alkylation response protein AidB-like acyl-CoA dehydrogenase